jgi:chemotaxis protein MotB
MPKSDSDEIIVSKPSKKSSPARRFPWRLWMYAIAMTAGAVGGGYYTWHYRSDKNAAESERDSCKEDRNKLKTQLTGMDTLQKQFNECASKLGDEKKRADGLQVLNASQTIAPAAAAGPAGAAGAAGNDANQRAEADRRNAAIDELQKQLARTANVTASNRRGAFVLTLPADALFTAGTADLTDPGKISVNEVGFALKRVADRRFLVTGFTDDAAAKPPFKDNWELSAARALSVVRLLVQVGVDPRNLVAGGASNNDPIGKDAAKNRRIEIALAPAAGELLPLAATLGPDTAPASTSTGTGTAPSTPDPKAAKPAAPAPAKLDPAAHL